MIYNKFSFRLSFLLLLPMLLGGCGLAKLASIQRESDLTVVESTLEENLGTLERLAKLGNTGIIVKAARACSSYAGFFEDRMEEAEIAGDMETAEKMRTQAIDHYIRAEGYAFKVLEKSHIAFREPRTVEIPVFEKALKRVKKKQVEPLFWAAYAVGRGISLQKDDPMQVIDLVRVEKMMQRILDLDETFYYGSAHLFYAVYYGDRAPTIGGDPEKAKEHIERVDEINDGKFLMSKYYLARYYAYPKQDAELYKQALQEVLDAPSDIYPGEEAATSLAKSRAKRWLDQIDMLFDLEMDEGETE
jgi:tetratricopeptide (TPR) repeat protein